MKSLTIKLLLLCCLIFQAGCDLTLKKKSKSAKMSSDKMDSLKMNSAEMKKNSKKKSSKASMKYEMRDHDSDMITSYYSDEVNATIRKDMISHTAITKKQAKKLKVGKIIPREIQIIPLPMELEKRLTSLSLDKIRVQIGKYVVLMDVKSRRILDIIKI